jgi:alpha-tubulin suppressor-like RCC1 family protein
MFPLIPDLQRELGEYLDLRELEYLLNYNADVDLEYEVISSDKWWRYLAISKYNFTSLELDNFKEKPIFKSLLPLFLDNKIAAGFKHSLALDNQGKLYTWGENDFGQLGFGDYEDRTIPTLIKSELTFRTIAAGSYHSITLDNQGKLYAWGWNYDGQLGLGDCGFDKDRTIPTLIRSELTFKAIVAGSRHSLALDTKGKLYAWGWNEFGQLGLDYSGCNTTRTIPTLVSKELTFRTIAAGSRHSLAIDTKGKLYAWGYNVYGQLGLGNSGYGKNRTIPTPVAPELTFKTIAAGYFYSLALDTKGKLYTWGSNDRGQLGLGDKENRTIPTLIKSELTFRTITARLKHSLALDNQGKLYAWGYNKDGQLGLSDYKDRAIPTPVTPELTFRTIAAGDYHSVALDNQGKLYAWGNNEEGQLGMGDCGLSKNRSIPTPIKSVLTFRTIAAGSRHSLALDTKSKLYAWGYNKYGQLGLGDDGHGTNRTIPTLIKSELTFRTIAAGSSHSLALDNQSKLYAWVKIMNGS